MLRSFNIRRFFKCSQHNFSTVSSSTLDVPNDDQKITDKVEPSLSDQSRLVAAAFASLKGISKDSNPKQIIQGEIFSAKDLNSLLAIVEKPFLTRHNALMILNVLTNWASEGKIKLADFEMDQRFAKLCRILGTGGKNGDLADLSVVLGVTADEQAAKLISSISLSQMIKILKSLSVKKRRSTPLLRSLAYNIANLSQKLDIKDASDVFYAMAELNFPDEVLLEKVRDDILECLSATQKHSVICSIIRSVGLLRFRDAELLDQLSGWIVKHSISLETKDLVPLLLTLASVNYLPENFSRFLKILSPRLVEKEMIDLNKFIDIAWSLIILQQYDQRIINSVLDPEFISKLPANRGSVESIEVPEKIRLLQINGAAKQLGDAYEGPLLDENSALYLIPPAQRKEKQILINSIKDTFSNVTNLDEYVELNVDSKMAFCIDFVCYVDSKSSFVKIDSSQSPGVKKVALMVCDYHDFCRGCRNQLTGSTALKHRLLSGMNYIVVPIPYMEYNPRDILMNRIRYIQEKIRENVSET